MSRLSAPSDRIRGEEPTAFPELQRLRGEDLLQRPRVDSAAARKAEAFAGAPESLRPNAMSATQTPGNSRPFQRVEDPPAELQEMTLAEAAEWYARKGFPVFPLHSVAEGRCSCRDDCCRHPGKHPRTPQGFKDATTDLAKVASYWQRHPDANIGLATGATSGLLFLDVDPRHGGDDSLASLISKHGPLPDTAQQTTGGGGKHIGFRFPAGVSLPSELAPGIELKGNGRYIVVAPSLHFSGRRYQWDGVRAEDALLSPAEAPVWLLDLIKTKSTSSKHRANGSGAGEPRTAEYWPSVPRWIDAWRGNVPGGYQSGIAGGEQIPLPSTFG
jgi:hypothetical protein